MIKTCQECLITFKTRDHRRKFCSPVCYHLKAKREPTGFQKGHQTWNKNVKGLHHSPETQFKKGHNLTPRLTVGTVTIRQHKGDSKRAWIKVAEPSVWQLRAIVVWEQAHGQSLPKGMIVHHRDRDSLNDNPSNLEALTRSEHIQEHKSEFQRRRWRRKPKITLPAIESEQVDLPLSANI